VDPDAGPEPLAWYSSSRAVYSGGNQVDLLRGGDALFPAMCRAINGATREVYVATYIFNDSDGAAQTICDVLAAAAGRGVLVRVVVDGFGSAHAIAALRERLEPAGVALKVFRPLHRWWSWLQPGQLRRLHQKLCVVDGEVGFVGGINLMDDRHDLRHGWSERPRLDYAVELRGPVVVPMAQTARAMWMRAAFGRDWRDDVLQIVSSGQPLARTRNLLRRLRILARQPPGTAPPRGLTPVRAAFLVRDNLRQRRSIERSYIDALRGARQRIDIVCSYFYPGRDFRRALTAAAQRGVKVRLLLQGKADYQLAALAAQAVYDELLGRGVHIYEYGAAFLHAKVAVVDDDWATVGSSNIDPLSLLLNLEANVVIDDPAFVATLAAELERDFAESQQVIAPPPLAGWRRWVRRSFVASVAAIYLRVAGAAGRY